MPANHSLLPALLLTSLVALSGAALADTSVAGLVDVSADASAHVDASGAQALAQQAFADAQANADQAKASASAKVEEGADAAADAQAHAESGLKANLHALGGWIRGLFGAAQETRAEVQASVQAPDVPQPPQPQVGFLATIQASLSALIH